ncbi:uncharacterized protein [Rutidosis leptorrhynchoides]|uniref:uncharacterized protein n=1 Tax=Rutidosis leptorrhynchoides TaxID=125765 RepID=UPI003A98F9B0
MDLVLQRRATKSVRPVKPKILWKKLNGEKAEYFKTSVSHVDADQMWNRLASTIREVAKEALGVAVGTSRGHKSDRESWWISDEVQIKVALKQLRKLDSKEEVNDINRIAKARERRRRDLDSIKCIKEEVGQTLVKEDEIRKRREWYFSSLFIGERSGHLEDLQEFDIEQSQNNMDCERINQKEVRVALRKMGRNKAVGPDQIPIEAWSSKMPMEWRLSETIPIYKNKGNAQICGSYRGIKLLSHTTKLWERVIETRLRRITSISENQFGFMPGRSSIDLIHIIRNLMEKYREKK